MEFHFELGVGRDTQHTRDAAEARALGYDLSHTLMEAAWISWGCSNKWPHTGAFERHKYSPSSRCQMSPFKVLARPRPLGRFWRTHSCLFQLLVLPAPLGSGHITPASASFSHCLLRVWSGHPVSYSPQKSGRTGLTQAHLLITRSLT